MNALEHGMAWHSIEELNALITQPDHMKTVRKPVDVRFSFVNQSYYRQLKYIIKIVKIKEG